MARRAKEKEIVIDEKDLKNTVEVESDSKVAKKSTKKATVKSAKKTTAKTAKKAEEKSTAKEEKKVASKTSTKASSKSTKSADAKTTKKVADKKAKTTKSTSASKSKKSTTTSKATTKRKSKTTKSDSEKTTNLEVLEYYDLPYKYGNTLVKLLAQTPKTLFIYWEISDLDIANYKKQFGENFFNVTKPILIVHNITLDKTYEVEINDFANCWYLTTEDADCKFDIELARKFIGGKADDESANIEANVEKETDSYLHVAKSNNLQSPNDHILFEKLTEAVTFTDVKTGKSKKEDIKDFKFLNNLYKFYKDMYKDMYKDEFLKNPSSKINI